MVHLFATILDSTIFTASPGITHTDCQQSVVVEAHVAEQNRIERQIPPSLAGVLRQGTLCVLF